MTRNNDQQSLLLSAEHIETLLTSTTAASLQIEVQPCVTSTNTLLKEAAREGAPHGKVLIALEQTAGKGRLGRSFYSPSRTGLYISLLLRPQLPPEKATLLTTVAAVAVARAMEEVTGESVGIKWVNDVYRNGRKLCGILTEASVSTVATASADPALDFAIVGIGINLITPPGGFPEAIRDIAGALYETETDCPADLRPRLTAALLNHFMEYYKKLPETTFLEEYRKRSFLLGQDIYVLGALDATGGHLENARLAHAEAIDDELRLVVTYPDGTREVLSSGEVSVRIYENTNQKNRFV